MTKQLTLDEMLECLIALRHPSANKFQKVIEATADAIAHILARELKVHAGPATFQGTGLAGTCAPFRPSFKGQPCPAPLCDYDPGEWSEECHCRGNSESHNIRARR
ncbi:MAG TPA: hypothetical protein VEK34_14385 [Methylocella sp.]|nr:hypothetical protein [Methylocella sp.]